jgi:hypothetical protein
MQKARTSPRPRNHKIIQHSFAPVTRYFSGSGQLPQVKKAFPRPHPRAPAKALAHLGTSPLIKPGKELGSVVSEAAHWTDKENGCIGGIGRALLQRDGA